MREYRSFVKRGRGIGVWAELRGGVILGTDQSVEELKPLFWGRTPRVEIPCRQQLVARPRLEDLFAGIKDKADRDERIYQAVLVYGYILKGSGRCAGVVPPDGELIAKRVAEAKKYQK